MIYYFIYLFLSLSVSVHSQTLMFSQQPEAYYYVHTDVPLTIQCVSTGTSITYRRANSGVSTTTSNAAYTQSNPVFNVDASIAGVDWDCLAEDGSGNIVSSRARVFWSTFSDSSSSAGNPRQIDLRNTVSSYLPCNFFNGSTPTPTVTWLRDGASFTANNLPGSNSLFLERADIVANPTATYRCVLTNHLGGSGTAVQANREYQLRVSSTTTTFQAHYFPNTDITVTAGDTIYFECVGIGIACTWEQLSNGVWGPLPNTAVEQYSGALTSFQITMESSIQYRATLGFEIQAPFTVTINESPNVVSSIQGMLVEYEQQDISIYCESTGIPTPDITWYHDELLVQNQANKYTLTPAGNRSTLQIQILANSDSGYYTCRADSMIGSDVVISRLSVRLAGVSLTFIQNPTPNSIASATNGMFIITCIASGDPAPDIIWTFTPKDTSDQQTIVANSKYSISTNKSIEAVPVQSTLNVSSFDSRDNGNYQCTATNFRSSLQSTISTVLIATDPVILTTFPNTSVVVLENAIVTQDCEVVGEPSPTVKWFYDSTEITEDTSVLTIFPNNTLRIDATRLQSGTMYRCQAMNSGATVSSSFILVVQSCPRVVVPPTFIQNPTPNSITSVTNGMFIITCIASGDPAPDIIWTFTPKDTSDQQTIVTNSKYSIRTNKSIEAVPVQSTLNVSSFDSRDNGNYQCTATNFRSSLQSTTSTVLIATDPVILTTFPSTSVVVMENTVVTQDCEIEGEPSSTVKWFSGSTEITEDTSVLTVFPNNTLRIDTTRLQSGTTYRCQAMNSGATVSSSFILVVQSCPRVVVSPTGPLNSPTQVNASLSCEVSGNPSPVSMWTYRSPGSDTPGDLPGTQNNVMEREENGVFKVDIIPITQNNQGKYCCEAYTQALESSCGASPQEMMCEDVVYKASCVDLYFCIFELWHLIVIYVGGFVIVVLIVCDVSCLIYLIFRSLCIKYRSTHKVESHQYDYIRSCQIPIISPQQQQQSPADAKYYMEMRSPTDASNPPASNYELIMKWRSFYI